MLQGTDFERLDRVDSRRARTAGSNSIAGRASRPGQRPFVASGKSRPHLPMGLSFERQPAPWPL